MRFRLCEFGALTKGYGKHIDDFIRACSNVFMHLLEKFTNSSFRKKIVRLFLRTAWQTTIQQHQTGSKNKNIMPSSHLTN